MNVPIYESASSLFAEKRMFNLDAIRKNAMFSLMEHLSPSTNTIIDAICNSEVKIHSKTWKTWAVELGVQWDYIMML